MLHGLPPSGSGKQLSSLLLMTSKQRHIMRAIFRGEKFSGAPWLTTGAHCENCCCAEASDAPRASRNGNAAPRNLVLLLQLQDHIPTSLNKTSISVLSSQLKCKAQWQSKLKQARNYF